MSQPNTLWSDPHKYSMVDVWSLSDFFLGSTIFQFPAKVSREYFGLRRYYSCYNSLFLFRRDVFRRRLECAHFLGLDSLYSPYIKKERDFLYYYFNYNPADIYLFGGRLLTISAQIYSYLMLVDSGIHQVQTQLHLRPFLYLFLKETIRDKLRRLYTLICDEKASFSSLRHLKEDVYHRPRVLGRSLYLFFSSRHLAINRVFKKYSLAYRNFVWSKLLLSYKQENRKDLDFIYDELFKIYIERFNLESKFKDKETASISLLTEICERNRQDYIKEATRHNFTDIIDRVTQFSESLSHSLVSRVRRRYQQHLLVNPGSVIADSALLDKLQMPFWNLYSVISVDEEKEVFHILKTDPQALQLFSYLYAIVDGVLFFFLNLPILSVEFVFANPERRRVIRDSIFPLLTLNFLLLYNVLEKFFHLANLGDYLQAVRNYVTNNIHPTLIKDFFHYLEIQLRSYDSEKGLTLLKKYVSNFANLSLVENPGRIYSILSPSGGSEGEK